jgi:gliding motility-associated-like protein
VILRILLLLLLNCVSYFLVGQTPASCKDSFFHRQLSASIGDSHFDGAVNASNEVYSAGAIGTSVPGYGRITKFNDEGNILWSNYYYTGMEGGGNATMYRHIISSSDNSIITSGLIVPGNLTTRSFIGKIDAAGNPVWIKEFLPVYGEIQLCQVADGGIVYVMYDANALPHVVGKLDLNGNTLWTKTINTPKTPSSMGYYGSSVIASGNTVFLSINISETPIKVAGNIFKINANDGSIIWEKKITRIDLSIDIEALNEVDNRLYFQFKAGHNYFNSDLKGRFSMDKDGNIINVLAFDVSANNLRFQFSKDDPFIASIGYSDNKTGLLYTDKDGNILWKYKYNLSLPQLNIAGITKNKNGGWFLNSIHMISATHQTPNAMFSKVSADGKLPYCGIDANIPLSVINLVLPVTTDNHTFTNNSLTPTNGHLNYAILPYTITDVCKSYTTCNDIVLNGKDKVCNFSDTVTYTGRRTAGCVMAVHWKYDASFVSYANETDTSLSVVFAKNGKFELIGNLSTACNLLADTMEITVAGSPVTIDLGADASLCAKNTRLLDAGAGFSNYVWQDGSGYHTFLVTQPGTYSVTAANACAQTFKDEIVFTAAPPVSIDLGPDLKKCNDDVVELTAPAGFINYSWGPDYNINRQSGQTINLFPVIDTLYYVAAEKTPGCFAFDTVRIAVNRSLPVNLGADTALCRSTSLQLDAGAGFDHYQWNTGSVEKDIMVTEAGSYYVKATAANKCVSGDTIVVKVSSLPVSLLPIDTTLCQNTSLTLQAPGSFAGYLWSNGAAEPAIVVTYAGQYWLQVTDEFKCTVKDTVAIAFIECKFFMPNAFTPNLDGKNDVFRPSILGKTRQYRLILFNRWGQKVFTSTDPQKGWDGKVNGISQNAGMFVWQCVFQFDGQQVENRRGTVLLLR